MDRSKLTGIPDWGNLSSIYQQLNRTLNPMKDINSLAKLTDSIGISGIARQFDQIAKMNQRYNAIDRLISPTLNISRLVNDYQKLNDPSDMLRKIVMGGSTISSFAQSLQNTSKAFDVTVGGLALGIQEKLNSSLYQKQLSIVEQLSKGYFATNHLAAPSWIQELSESKIRLEAERLSLFDILSANTFTRITEDVLEEVEEPVEPDQQIDQISQLLNENAELKQDLQLLYFSFSRRIASKLRRGRRIKTKDLKEPSKLLAEIIHKKLFKTDSVSLQTVYTFICLIEYVFTVIFIGIILEKRGANIYDNVVGPDENNISQQPVVNNTYNITNSYNAVKMDSLNKNTPVYLRNSLKTKCIGRIIANTTVLILGEKAGWRFVEGVVEKRNKKGEKTSESVLRGWVEKKYLVSSNN